MPRNGRLGLQAYARILAEITTTPKTLPTKRTTFRFEA